MTELIAQLPSFWISVLNHCWQTSLFILFIFVVEKAMAYPPGRWLERLWFVGLLSLVMPSGWLKLSFSLPGKMELDPVQQIWALPENLVLVSAEKPGQSFLFPIITCVWVAVVLIKTVILFKQNRTQNYHKELPLRKLQPADRAILKDALNTTGIDYKNVRWSDQTTMPHVTGFLRPVIIVPQAIISKLPTEQLQAILIHENSHRRRRDPLRSLGYAWLKILLFFHPLIYLVTGKLRESSEFIGDERSLASGLSGKEYAQTLAATLVLNLDSPHTLGVSSFWEKSPLASRISRFNFLERKVHMLRYRLLFLLVVVVFTIGMLSPVAEIPKSFAGNNLQKLASITIETSEPDVEKEIPEVIEITTSPAGENLQKLGPFKIIATKPGDKNRRPEVIEIATLSTGNKPKKVAAITIETSKYIAEDVTVAENELPSLVFFAKPDYPSDCQAANISGTVIVKVFIDIEGNVKETELMEGPKCLQQSALDASEKCRFKPGVKNGKPVDSWVAIPYSFEME